MVEVCLNCQLKSNSSYVAVADELMMLSVKVIPPFYEYFAAEFFFKVWVCTNIKHWLAIELTQFLHLVKILVMYTLKLTFFLMTSWRINNTGKVKALLLCLPCVYCVLLEELLLLWQLSGLPISFSLKGDSIPCLLVWKVVCTPFLWYVKCCENVWITTISSRYILWLQLLHVLNNSFALCVAAVRSWASTGRTSCKSQAITVARVKNTWCVRFIKNEEQQEKNCPLIIYVVQFHKRIHLISYFKIWFRMSLSFTVLQCFSLWRKQGSLCSVFFIVWLCETNMVCQLIFTKQCWQ